MKSPVHPIAIRCELDSIEEPIRGRLSGSAGGKVEFSGWMEFSTVLLGLARDDAKSTQRVQPTEEGTT
jgi:hypothetical protein